MKINQMYANNMTFANKMNYNSQKVRESDARMSAGKVVNNPSDHAKISKAESAVKQSKIVQSQLTDNQSYLATVQTVLETGKDIGMRLKELSTIYQSETISKDEQKEIRKEAMELSKTLKDIFGNASFNGKKIFSPNKQGAVSTTIQLDIPDMKFINTLANRLDSADILKDLINPLEKSLNSVVGAMQTPTIPLVSIQKASQAYTQSMDSQSQINETQAVAETSYKASSSSLSVSTKSYAEGFISNLVNNTLKSILSEHKEALNYLSTRDPYDVYKDIKSQTYESLHKLSKDYGYEKEFLIADKLGVWDLIGLKKNQAPPPEAPTEPKPPVETKPPVEVPNETTPPNETTDGGDGVGLPPAPPSQEGAVGSESGGASGDNGNAEESEPVTIPPGGGIDNEGVSPGETPENENPIPPTSEELPNNETPKEDGGIDIGIGVGDGNGSGDIGIDVGVGVGNGNGDSNKDDISDTDTTTPVVDDKEPIVTPGISGDVLDEMKDWFTPDFVDKEFLDVISNAQSDIDIKNRILEFRKNYEERMNQINEERLARLQEVDISKEMAEKAKNAMLEQINAYLLQWNMNHQKRMIDFLF